MEKEKRATIQLQQKVGFSQGRVLRSLQMVVVLFQPLPGILSPALEAVEVQDDPTGFTLQVGALRTENLWCLWLPMSPGGGLEGCNFTSLLTVATNGAISWALLPCREKDTWGNAPVPLSPGCFGQLTAVLVPRASSDGAFITSPGCSVYFSLFLFSFTSGWFFAGSHLFTTLESLWCRIKLFCCDKAYVRDVGALNLNDFLIVWLHIACCWNRQWSGESNAVQTKHRYQYTSPLFAFPGPKASNTQACGHWAQFDLTYPSETV